MVNLAGCVEETRGMLDERRAAVLDEAIDEMKTATHDFVEKTRERLYGLIEASKIWRKLSPEKKEQLIHDIYMNAEEELDPNGEYLKA